MKASHPLQVAKYAISKGIDNEPTFHWWVTQVAKTSDHIVGSVQARYLKGQQKFGIDIPRVVEEALAIDRETNTTFWSNAIEKEM